MKHIKVIVFLFLTIFIAGCDTVHEFPEEPKTETSDIEVGIHLTVIDDLNNLSDYKTVEGLKASVQCEYKIRNIVEVYSAEERIFRDTILTDKVNEKDVFFKMTLPLNKEFQVLAWIDRVDPANPSDLFYETNETNSLNRIGLATTDYQASLDAKEAFAGRHTFTTLNQDIEADSIIHKKVELSRPMGKFRIITTDLKKYYQMNGKKPTTVKLTYGSDLPLLCDPHKSIIHYTDGLSVTSQILGFTEDECTFIFDWVLALDEEMILPVSFEVFDEDGVLITTSPVIEIPLVRNKLTTVKDRFLTADHSGGIGIDDKFEGEIIIEL